MRKKPRTVYLRPLVVDRPWFVSGSIKNIANYWVPLRTGRKWETAWIAFRNIHKICDENKSK